MTKTWLANGGGQFAPTADKAAAWQQQIVADRIYARQGAAPWQCKTGPGPSQFANFAQSGGTTSAATVVAVPASAQAAPVAASSRSSADSTDHYTVVAGDTLSGIAQKLGVAGGWAQLQQLNHIPDANVISVGQDIAVK